MIEDDDISRAVDAGRRRDAEYVARLDDAVQNRDETAIEHLAGRAVTRVLGRAAEAGFDVVRHVWNWLVGH
ncbi:hypothetical protein Ssi03_05610 [Sphaerisporangium siamense]|uniref:Uncharacterized protein n=1 Tax=Sphaerisporangium siamense TaxID=795645 RepID=A0A7W7GCP6_9ACTN|nr:hypothetical protein [Sphaerisporangium siamense]MBB4704095.1 hypothetical protein [Sphaerisporangium siamense]GII82571.1 hypothetical protein Ssi03_05610 [Sphaerisporangium siamense]